MGSGFLAGKYSPGQRVVPGTRSESKWAWHERFFAANADETLSVLLDVANELGRTPAQVALRWVLEQPAVSAVIAGVRTEAHLRDNAGASGWRLEGELLARLNAVSALPYRYPESFENTMEKRRADALDMPVLCD
jgi:aryl-alcohol dehydrogenase-like predicted oxidoreductase